MEVGYRTIQKCTGIWKVQCIPSPIQKIYIHVCGFVWQSRGERRRRLNAKTAPASRNRRIPSVQLKKTRGKNSYRFCNKQKEYHKKFFLAILSSLYIYPHMILIWVHFYVVFSDRNGIPMFFTNVVFDHIFNISL